MGPRSSSNMSNSSSVKVVNLPRLAKDSSNWVTYKERTLNNLTSKGLMRHVRGTAHQPVQLTEWNGSYYCVRISPVALQLGSEMDPCRRDLTNILHSYLVSDSFGPVLGARAWSCKTTKRLPRLITTPEHFGNLRREMSQVATRTFNVYITFLLYGLLGLTILDHIYSSFL